jgi:predicted DNA binding protein
MGALKEFFDETDIATRNRHTRVEVEVIPSENCSCPVKEASSSGLNIDEVRKTTTENRCKSEILTNDSERGPEVVNAVTSVEDSCFCPVFDSFGVLPKIEEVKEGRIVISTYVSDRRDIKSVLERLRSKADKVRVRRIGPVEDCEDLLDSTDMHEMTTKQKETLEVAVSEGYYDEPEEITLGELADRFDVSKSAVSQRLKRAESKIVISSLEE